MKTAHEIAAQLGFLKQADDLPGPQTPTPIDPSAKPPSAGVAKPTPGTPLGEPVMPQAAPEPAGLGAPPAGLDATPEGDLGSLDAPSPGGSDPRIQRLERVLTELVDEESDPYRLKALLFPGTPKPPNSSPKAV